MQTTFSTAEPYHPKGYPPWVLDAAEDLADVLGLMPVAEDVIAEVIWFHYQDASEESP